MPDMMVRPVSGSVNTERRVSPPTTVCNTHFSLIRLCFAPSATWNLTGFQGTLIYMCSANDYDPTTEFSTITRYILQTNTGSDITGTNLVNFFAYIIGVHLDDTPHTPSFLALLTELRTVARIPQHRSKHGKRSIHKYTGRHQFECQRRERRSIRSCVYPADCVIIQACNRSRKHQPAMAIIESHRIQYQLYVLLF